MREVKNLDQDTVELISIGVASALRCEHCLKMHVRIAKRRGISKEKIFSAIMIGHLCQMRIACRKYKSSCFGISDENGKNKEEKTKKKSNATTLTARYAILPEHI